MTSKSLKIFNFELDIHDYVQEIYTLQIFISIRSAGASAQIGEILRFCDLFPGYTVFFLGDAPRSNRGWKVTVYGSYDVFSPKYGPFGGCNSIGIHLGVICTKTRGGVNRQFQDKLAEYKKSRYLAKYKYD